MISNLINCSSTKAKNTNNTIKHRINIDKSQKMRISENMGVKNWLPWKRQSW